MRGFALRAAVAAAACLGGLEPARATDVVLTRSKVNCLPVFATSGNFEFDGTSNKDVHCIVALLDVVLQGNEFTQEVDMRPRAFPFYVLDNESGMRTALLNSSHIEVSFGQPEPAVCGGLDLKVDQDLQLDLACSAGRCRAFANGAQACQFNTTVDVPSVSVVRVGRTAKNERSQGLIRFIRWRDRDVLATFSPTLSPSGSPTPTPTPAPSRAPTQGPTPAAVAPTTTPLPESGAESSNFSREPRDDDIALGLGIGLLVTSFVGGLFGLRRKLQRDKAQLALEGPDKPDSAGTGSSMSAANYNSRHSTATDNAVFTVLATPAKTRTIAGQSSLSVSSFNPHHSGATERAVVGENENRGAYVRWIGASAAHWRFISWLRSQTRQPWTTVRPVSHDERRAPIDV